MLVAPACAGGDPDAETPSEGIDSLGATNDDGASSIDVDERLDLGAGSGDDARPDGERGCEADLVDTALVPVSLGFAFDVSASMGNFDEPWYDPALKWDPVVAAMQEFFADAALTGVEASMTFFPAAADKCEASSYATPDVATTILPSAAFVDAMHAVRPATDDAWRSGTPTLAVTRATLSRLDALQADDPSRRYAYVLVSDGYPQGCEPPDNDIAEIAAVVKSHAERVPTYVVGVKNPPPGPDLVSDLDAVAAAGGSEHAYLVETGDPTQTAATFAAAIDAIRTAVGDCRLEIPPPPPGVQFDPTKINVTYDGVQLGYDPACATAEGWRFDDPAMPTQIVLCPELCAQVQNDPDRELTLGFGCDREPAEG